MVVVLEVSLELAKHDGAVETSAAIWQRTRCETLCYEALRCNITERSATVLSFFGHTSGAAGGEIAHSRRVVDLGVDEDREAALRLQLSPGSFARRRGSKSYCSISISQAFLA